MVMTSVVAFVLGLMVGLTVWLRTRLRSDREAAELTLRIATFEKERAADADKLGWIDEAEVKMREAFAALAGEALRSNSATLTAQARTDLEGVIDPLKRNLDSLDGHVRDLEKARQGAYESLGHQLSELRQAHTKLQETTVTLAQALRSPTVRGRWGEIQLRRVVEMAGMVSHVAFDEQTSTDSGRPDMIVYLPNGGVLPVDAKVPLDSYLTAMEGVDEESRKHNLASHAKAMRERIRLLGHKQYQDQFESSPDFVVMFVPNEACLGAAFEHDPGLFEYAVDKGVLIGSPVTLLALLRAVAYGWQQQDMAENATKIAHEGQELYGRLQAFIERFAEVGDYLGRSVERYNRAVGSLDRRLMPAVKRFEELGLSTTEQEEPAEIAIVPSPPTTGDGTGEDRE